MKKLAVFVSGGGTDMQSIIDGIAVGKINAQIKLVIASRNGIFAIERAKKCNIPVLVFDKNSYKSLDDMDEAIKLALDEAGIDYAILAGYLNIITPILVRAYQNKIINIHPSLIPRHAGRGFYGMKVHQSVIDSGDKVTGATVHFVDEGTDTGKIIEQCQIEVKEYDTAEDVAKKVLELEHKMLPEVVAKLCSES